MNCTYDSFAQAIRHLGLPEYAAVWDKYASLKKMVYGNMQPYVFAGILPWLYGEMLMEFNIISRQKLSMIIEWNSKYISWDGLFEEADDKEKSIMYFNTIYKGEFSENITLKPAIYGLLNEQHAMFSETIPEWKGARVIMTAQIRLYDLDKRNGKKTSA